MITASQPLTIVKLNLQREETWRYQGRLQKMDDLGVVIEAYFNREDLSFHGIIFKQNDRFIERYFHSRWYNIFEIHDRDNDHLKGWYCNVTQPAEFSPGKIAYVDLALDLLVYPNGEYLILDEEEFVDLRLSSAARAKARQGLRELIGMAKTNHLQDFLK
jgi:uncharacterized protein